MADPTPTPAELRAAREKAVADEAWSQWTDEGQRLKNLYLYMLMNCDGVRVSHCPALIAAELKRLYPDEKGKK